MAISIQKQKQNGLAVEFNVTVPKAVIQARTTAKLQEYGKDVKLDGFRPGKAPVALLEQRFGPRVKGEVLQEVISEATEQAAKEHTLRPVGRPKIDIQKFEPNADLTYTMIIENTPEFKLPDLSTIKIQYTTAAVDETELNDALSKIAERNRGTEPVSGPRKAANGDRVMVDFEGFLNGVAFAGGKGTDVPLELGSNTMIPGFEEQLVGQMVPGACEIKVKFPADYRAKNLAGQDATFKITLKSLLTVLPAKVDDELAKRLGMESLEALKNVLRDQMQKEIDQLARMRSKRTLFDALDQNVSVDLPQTLVASELELIERQVKQMKGQHAAADPDHVHDENCDHDHDHDSAEAADVGLDDVDESQLNNPAYLKKLAERRVKLGLLLTDIGIKNNINVTPQEMQEGVWRQASQYPGQEKQVIQYFQNNPSALEHVRAPIFEDKVVDFLLSKVQKEEVRVSVAELRSAVDGQDAAASDSAKAGSTRSGKKAKADSASDTKPKAKK